MFTGIIEEIGKVVSIGKGEKSSTLSIQGKMVFEDMKVGDSIAVDGVCLTVKKYSDCVFMADVMGETLKRSSLGALKIGAKVNLERAMPVNGRFGGHLVSGHIDGTGIISKNRKEDTASWFTIDTAPSILKYIVEKGSICIDGISLTVASVSKNSFEVSIIPHTASATVLGYRVIGDAVNLEVDLIGKYIEKLMGSSTQLNTNGSVTMELLAKSGF